MLRVGPDGFLRPDDARAEIERLKRLLCDLDAMALGSGPTVGQINQAPFLEQWVIGNLPAPHLIGLVTGHPEKVGTGRAIRTSQVMVVDDESRWARTLSRFFRLGSPL